MDMRLKLTGTFVCLWLGLSYYTSAAGDPLSMTLLGPPPEFLAGPPKPPWIESMPSCAAKGSSKHLTMSSVTSDEDIRYIIVILLSILTAICILLTIGIVYLKRRYLKYQIFPDIPSEETNFLWNYRMRGLRWNRYRSAESRQAPAQEQAQEQNHPHSQQNSTNEFTDLTQTQEAQKKPLRSNHLREKMELKERCNSCTSSGISLSNSDIQEDNHDEKAAIQMDQTVCVRDKCTSAPQTPDIVASTLRRSSLKAKTAEMHRHSLARLPVVGRGSEDTSLNEPTTSEQAVRPHQSQESWSRPPVPVPRPRQLTTSTGTLTCSARRPIRMGRRDLWREEKQKSNPYSTIGRIHYSQPLEAVSVNPYLHQMEPPAQQVDFPRHQQRELEDYPVAYQRETATDWRCVESEPGSAPAPHRQRRRRRKRRSYSAASASSADRHNDHALRAVKRHPSESDSQATYNSIGYESDNEIEV